GGCASPSSQANLRSDPPSAIPATAAHPPLAVSPTHTVIGRSVQGRLIDLYTFAPAGAGAGDRPVLVMGTIHGNEPTSANFAAGLLADLRADPQLAAGVPVAVIPVANPDGLAANTRTNSNKVDLNRNFPANNWSARAPKAARNNFGG